MAPKIITVANQKGGVAKTTTAVSLAAGLVQRGKEVLLVDLDPQGNAARALGMDPEPGVYYLLTMGNDPISNQTVKQWVRNTGREKLWLIAGNQMTNAAQVTINALDCPISHIRDVLKRFMQNGLNYIILDTAPSVGGIQERALWAADLVLIPTAADYLSTDGVRQISQTLARLQSEKGWKGALLGVLPTFVEDNLKEHRAALADLKQIFNHLLLPAIHKAATVRECPGMGATIFEKDPESRAAEEYRALVDRVVRY